MSFSFIGYSVFINKQAKYLSLWGKWFKSNCFLGSYTYQLFNIELCSCYFQTFQSILDTKFRLINSLICLFALQSWQPQAPGFTDSNKNIIIHDL